jgi:hypothetical protein
MNNCPWCGAKAIDITTSADVRGFDQRKRFMCAGATCHEWRDGDTPEPQTEPLIILAT